MGLGESEAKGGSGGKDLTKYADGLESHGLSGTVVPRASGASSISSGARFDFASPTAFNVISVNPDGSETAVSVSPGDIPRISAEGYDPILAEKGRPAKPVNEVLHVSDPLDAVSVPTIEVVSAPVPVEAASETVVSRALPDGSVEPSALVPRVSGLNDILAPRAEKGLTEADLGFESHSSRPRKDAGRAERTYRRVSNVPNRLSPPPIVDEPARVRQPETPRSAFDPVIVPARTVGGVPGEKIYESGESDRDGDDGSLDDGMPKAEFEDHGVSAVPTGGKKLVRAVRERVRFVGSFGRLSIPYNMVWRYGFLLALFQYSEDGIFYEPQEASELLEIWWRDKLFVCMPSPVHLPFPDGKIALTIFFVNDEETDKRRKEPAP